MQNGFLYIGYNQSFTKLGKTINKKQTISTYSRLTEISSEFYECKNINIGEAILLNLLGPYRLSRLYSYDKDFISEEIDKRLNICFLKFIIKHICTYLDTNIIIDIPVSRSKNTFNRYRKLIPIDYIHILCKDITCYLTPKECFKHNIKNTFTTPMDTGDLDDEPIIYNIDIFDKFINLQ